MTQLPPINSLDLNRFKRIVFFTGAGISAESGIPTYRGKGGFWTHYNYEDYACQRAFDRDPEKVWDFHEERRRFVSECRPALGHRIIAEIQRHKPETRVITQNIDGMHQKAESVDVFELHGSLWRVRCPREDTREEIFDIPLKSRHCRCGAYLRPDIVWFEDPLDDAILKVSISAVLKCDLLITVGTSATVFPAAEIPLLALQRGVTSIEINLEPTEISRFYTYTMIGSAGKNLQSLLGQSSFPILHQD
ncbi:NAD-dependent deacylase [bacterium]|nr:NAD-dependent deacylase [candidate division CSSED10-310 bacterium]